MKFLVHPILRCSTCSAPVTVRARDHTGKCDLVLGHKGHLPCSCSSIPLCRHSATSTPHPAVGEAYAQPENICWCHGCRLQGLLCSVLGSERALSPHQPRRTAPSSPGPIAYVLPGPVAALPSLSPCMAASASFHHPSFHN